MRTFEYQNLLSLNECFASVLFAVKKNVVSLILFYSFVRILSKSSKIFFTLCEIFKQA